MSIGRAWGGEIARSQRPPPGPPPDEQHAPRNEESDRRQRVLTRGTPSITRTIADAVVLKDRDLFFLTEPDGRVPLEGEHGLGLYYRDCRFLNAYELLLAGDHPVSLGWSGRTGSSQEFLLTNSDLHANGRMVAQKEWLGIEWQRRLDGRALALADRLRFRNWHNETVELPVELRFGAAFEDVFQVRGLLPQRLGTRHPPEWRDRTLLFRYDGADGITRRIEIALPTGFEPGGPNAARTTVGLEPRGSAELAVELSIHESSDQPGAESGRTARLLDVNSDRIWLSRVIRRSAADLELLRSSMHGFEFCVAGIPWFGTLFGRDSLVAALQSLPFRPAMASQTLRLLARYQGSREDPWRDEQPGKILHELRRGEMARTGVIPHTPYYGTVDATPLFLMLLGRYAEWTGDLALFHELRPNVERALEWMRRHGDGDGDGYIEYRSRSREGLVNQGWKDSGDAIVDAQGDIATPPIALVEVQAYAYEARLLIADLYRRIGEEELARRLAHEADELRERFNRDYWVDRIGYYALALEADKRPLEVVSSNPGHALWCGIADPDKAAATVERLMAEDMYSGWGVRTLARSERGYSPISYHRGSVWPHDNAIIAAGCRRYGFDDPARRICGGVTHAAWRFEQARLPELFTGFARARARSPVRYPVACHPQAWAAGAVPFLLQTMLGLTADGFARRLRVTRPIMPAGTGLLEWCGLQVAGASVDLRFRRTHGGVTVETIGSSGDIEVSVEG